MFGFKKSGKKTGKKKQKKQWSPYALLGGKTPYGQQPGFAVAFATAYGGA